MKKETAPYNGLTPAQAERLALLVEELAEAGQAAAKVLRFGWDMRCHGDGPTGREQLVMELGDVLYAMYMSIDRRDLDEASILARQSLKEDRKEKFLFHQAEEP